MSLNYKIKLVDGFAKPVRQRYRPILNLTNYVSSFDLFRGKPFVALLNGYLFYGIGKIVKVVHQGHLIKIPEPKSRLKASHPSQRPYA